MSIFALADLHLAISTPEKTMEAFGPRWNNYMERMKEHWKSIVTIDDLVLLPGDLSWAMRPEEAKIDLEWIHALPGEKLLIRGNHDYWWASKAKLAKFLPPHMHCLHTNAFTWHDVTIGGCRLWDTPEYSFESFMEPSLPPLGEKKIKDASEAEHNEKIFARELERLRLSLSQLDPKAKLRIAMTHYPPIGADLRPSRTSIILEEFHIDICVFGHLHNVKFNALPFGKARGVQYFFTACDYLQCSPLKIYP